MYDYGHGYRSLTVSTLVTLIIIPTVYTSFVEAGNRRRARKAARIAAKNA